MHTGLLDILRCPFCGGRLELVTTLFHETDTDRVRNGVLGCECCTFPVVDGIPVMHLNAVTSAAREHITSGNTAAALLAMIGVSDPDRLEQVAAAVASPASTYRAIVDALGPGIEGGYFLYRLSGPTFVVADAVVRAVAGTVLAQGGRALDVCGGSGHLTRTLTSITPAPVLADLFFAKIWLAKRFTAPGAVPVCCDANGTLPFARGAFAFAMCCDALMYIWQKRQLLGEMSRAVDGTANGTVLINHTHNQLVWSASHGDTLTPAGYRGLFETSTPRVFGESSLFTDVVQGDTLDLSRTEPVEALDTEVALTLVSSPVEAVFRRHPLEAPRSTGGSWRLNPLYAVEARDGQILGTLTFPDEEYENEYGACRAYLPSTVQLDASALQAAEQGTVPESLAEFVRRRVLIELPRQFT